MEYCYGVTYDILPTGLTRRTVRGFARVPASLEAVDSRVPPDTADRLRERVIPGRLVGFRRVNPGTFELSLDKTRLDFTVADEQLPGPPPPPGVLSWRAGHTWASNQVALTKWAGRIDAAYEVAPGFDPAVVAVPHFFAVARDRVERLVKSRGVQGGSVIVTGMSFSEPDLTGLDRFRASLDFSVTVGNLAAFLKDSGLWLPPPDTGGWRAGDKSLDNVFSPRGVAGLYFSPGQDVILNLCTPEPAAGPATARPPRTPPSRAVPSRLFPRPPRRGVGWSISAGSRSAATAATPRSVPFPPASPHRPPGRAAASARRP